MCSEDVVVCGCGGVQTAKRTLAGSTNERTHPASARRSSRLFTLTRALPRPHNSGPRRLTIVPGRRCPPPAAIHSVAVHDCFTRRPRCGSRFAGHGAAWARSNRRAGPNGRGLVDLAGGICVRYDRALPSAVLDGALCYQPSWRSVRSSCSAVVLVLHLSRSLASLAPALTPCSSSSTGRVEMREFLVLYLLTLPFQLVTTGSFLEQVRTSLSPSFLPRVN